jgi:hypothetical protein
MYLYLCTWRGELPSTGDRLAAANTLVEEGVNDCTFAGPPVDVEYITSVNFLIFNFLNDMKCMLQYFPESLL